MGTGIGRIEREFILENLNDKKIPVDIHGDKKVDHGMILRFDEKEVTLCKEHGAWDHFDENEEVKVFFSYFGQVMTFTGNVKTAGDYLLISAPDSMYKNLQRKYERVVLPPGGTASFVFEDTTFELEFPKTEEYFDPMKSDLPLNDAPIQLLIGGLKEKAERIGATHKIQMYRERKPNCYEEDIVTITGKILYLPSIAVGYPKEELDMEGNILTEKVLLSKQYNSMIVHGIEGKGDLSEIVVKKRNEGIYSEIVCPIVYLDYVIGVIRIQGLRNNEIPRGFVDYIYQFSKVLVSALRANGYFSHMEPVEKDYDAEVVDISASGLLFAQPKNTVAEKITLYTDFDITVKLGDRKIIIPSRVMRKYISERRIYFGVQFMDMSPEDFRFLFESIYGRDFSKKDEEFWEGGAPPPELSL